jgi:hypothetical protein
MRAGFGLMLFHSALSQRMKIFDEGAHSPIIVCENNDNEFRCIMATAIFNAIRLALDCGYKVRADA